MSQRQDATPESPDAELAKPEAVGKLFLEFIYKLNEFKSAKLFKD